MSKGRPRPRTVADDWRAERMLPVQHSWLLDAPAACPFEVGFFLGSTTPHNSTLLEDARAASAQWEHIRLR